MMAAPAVGVQSRLAQTRAGGNQSAIRRGVRDAGIQNHEIRFLQQRDPMRVGKQVVDQRDRGHAQIGRHLARVHHPRQIGGFHASVHHRARQPETSGIHRPRVGRQETCERSRSSPENCGTGKDLRLNRLQLLRRSLKKCQPSVGTADIAR